jgi:hypothetical protein
MYITALMGLRVGKFISGTMAEVRRSLLSNGSCLITDMFRNILDVVIMTGRDGFFVTVSGCEAFLHRSDREWPANGTAGAYTYSLLRPGLTAMT